MSEDGELAAEARKRAARKIIADVRQSPPGSSQGRTKFHLLGIEENIGLPPELEETARHQGSQRRLVSSQKRQVEVSQTPTQPELKEQYALPTLDAASWCPLDRGRLTATKVIQEATWSMDQSLSIKGVAIGVWILKPITKDQGLAHVDISGRRIFLATEWIRANNLKEAKGLLACATRRGVIIVDVRRAHFDKMENQ